MPLLSSFSRQCFLAQLYITSYFLMYLFFFLDTLSLPSRFIFIPWWIRGTKSRAESDTHSTKNANLPVSGLKKMKGGLIIFFFFCMFHNKPVHELGQESINCAVTHTGTNYLLAWKTISP